MRSLQPAPLLNFIVRPSDPDVDPLTVTREFLFRQQTRASIRTADALSVFAQKDEAK